MVEPLSIVGRAGIVHHHRPGWRFTTAAVKPTVVAREVLWSGKVTISDEPLRNFAVA